MSERTCIATRTVLPRDELIRFVLDPESRVVPDLKGKLPGRGVWVTARSEMIRRAVDKKLFARAFRGTAEAGPELAELVGDLLRDRALNLLGLANRAGLVSTGFTKVEGLIAKGVADILVEAADGASDGRTKLRNKFIARAPAGVDCEARIVSCFEIEQLSLALGRTNVVHAGLISGRLGDEFLAAARRLEGFGIQSRAAE